MTEDQTELTKTETEPTETEFFGHRFGSQFLLTELSTVNSVPCVGYPN